MPKRLVVIDGADQGNSFPLADGKTVSVGNSSRHSDICLHDLYVRRDHCRLEVQGDRVLARAGENAEMLVNGQSAREQELRSGDVVRVGNSHLRLEDAAAEEADEDEAAAAPPKAALPLPHLPAERLGELTDHMLAQYEVGPVLGRGHCGVVFRARDRKAGLTVALKVLFPDFPKDAGEMQQFVAALKSMLALRHPNLVALYNAGRTGPYCWLALEYVEGESLAQVLERTTAGGKNNWKHALRLAVHLGRALEFIHRHRLLHGNITPRNVLIRLSDKVGKLGDLMLSRALDGSRLQVATLEAKLLSELPYLAPEQADPNAFVDSLADIYGLGAVVYARLTGRPPFLGASPEETISQIHEAPLVRPREHQPNTPQALDVAVVKMLARHQEERYQTVAELVEDLERIAEREGLAI
jgi:serine/threonine protein kinase